MQPKLLLAVVYFILGCALLAESRAWGNGYLNVPQRSVNRLLTGVLSPAHGIISYSSADDISAFKDYLSRLGLHTEHRRGGSPVLRGQMYSYLSHGRFKKAETLLNSET